MLVLQHGTASRDYPELDLSFYTNGVLRYSPFTLSYAVTDSSGNILVGPSAKPWCKSVGLYVPNFIVDIAWVPGIYTITYTYRNQHYESERTRTQQFEVL